MEKKSIGVVGAGVIGSGVALNLTQTGHQVIVLDISEEILEKTKANIVNSHRLQILFHKNKIARNSSEILAQIRFSTDYSLFEDVDIVIENVTERWIIKEQVYKHIDAICAPRCIFVANTSAIPITRIASATKRPSKVIGVHFMNPVPMKEMVEMIPGYHTSDETVALVQDLLTQMGKKWIVVNDSPGFVSNRVLMPTINEAVFLLEEKVATVAEIDEIFKTCFGHPMGPLETADLIGLDTVLYSIKILHESFGDSKYRPCPLLQKMVDAKLFGRKSGQGFYTY